jgi:DNA-binding SARP family transcriptional activator
MARLRKNLHQWAANDDVVALVQRFPGYVLEIENRHLDLVHFTELAGESRKAWPSDPLTAAAYARQALALWRGSPFSGHPLGPLGEMARVRLEEIRLNTLEILMDSYLELGQHRQYVGDLKQLVVAHPFHERFHEQLMIALYRSGRQGEALKIFKQSRRRLREEAGVEPSPQLHHRVTQILHHDPALWQTCDGWRVNRASG